MIRPLSQGYVSHVTHNDILRHVRGAIENDVFVTPPAMFQRYLRGLVRPREKRFANFPSEEWHKSCATGSPQFARCVNAWLCRVWSMYRGVSALISFVIIGYCTAICNNAVVFGNYCARPIQTAAMAITRCCWLLASRKCIAAGESQCEHANRSYLSHRWCAILQENNCCAEPLSRAPK